MSVFVLNDNGERLMPTHEAKARKLLKAGQAVKYKNEPFTIKLTYHANNGTQDIELTEDTGYLYIGVSVKSEKREFVSAEYKLLKDEKEHHENCVRYRRIRRNRKRYRKARFNNRKINKDWLAPSLRHKKEQHVEIVKKYLEVCPITSVTLEMGQFDIQALKAIEEGKPLPQGEDYQHGETFGYDTLREAVFQRDGYKCRICKAENTPLKEHHIGYWRGDHSNRMKNLAAICEKCHTSKNHSKDGLLWGLPYAEGFKEAAFMNSVKWQIYEEVKALVETHITYGSVTKRERLALGLEKSHANDAYCIGRFRPMLRAETVYLEKKRRNNRVLEKFYDAKYIDIRDGKTKKGAEIGCNRTNRSIPRDNENNERKYRKRKVSKGRRNIRKSRTKAPVGCKLAYEGKIYTSGGTQHYGEYVILKELTNSVKPKSVRLDKCQILVLPLGWIKRKENAEQNALIHS